MFLLYKVHVVEISSHGEYSYYGSVFIALLLLSIILQFNNSYD